MLLELPFQAKVSLAVLPQGVQAPVMILHGDPLSTRSLASSPCKASAALELVLAAPHQQSSWHASSRASYLHHQLVQLQLLQHGLLWVQPLDLPGN